MGRALNGWKYRSFSRLILIGVETPLLYQFSRFAFGALDEYRYGTRANEKKTALTQDTVLRQLSEIVAPPCSRPSNNRKSKLLTSRSLAHHSDQRIYLLT